MTNLSTFNYLSNTVRVVEIDGQPWFVAMDVTNVLGITEKSRGYAVARLADDERSLYQIQKGQRSVSIISESGLYKLIMRSDKPEARKFQDWVTREVLPAIRKDGMYVAGEEKVKTGEMSIEEMELLVFENLRKKVARLQEEAEMERQRRLKAEAEAEILKGPAATGIITSRRSRKLKDVAQELPFLNITQIGNDLVRAGYLRRDIYRGGLLLPVGKYRDSHFYKQDVIVNGRAASQIMVGPQGYEVLARLYLNGRLTMKVNHTLAWRNYGTNEIRKILGLDPV